MMMAKHGMVVIVEMEMKMHTLVVVRIDSTNALSTWQIRNEIAWATTRVGGGRLEAFANSVSPIHSSD